MLFVDVVHNLTESAVGIVVRDVDSVDLKLLAFPVLVQPLVVRVIFLLVEEHVDFI